MRRFMRFSTLAAIALAASFDNLANAHFPWLTINEEGRAIYFFGENIADRTYHLPPTIADAKLFVRVDGKPQAIETTAVDSESMVGLRSKGLLSEQADVYSQVTFGVYHGARLDYYTQCLGRTLPKSFSDCQPLDATLQAHAVDTATGVDIFVLWQGKPLADAEVKLYCEDGHEEGAAKTDASGKVSFDDQQVEDGLNGIMVGHTVEDAKGQLDNQEYASASHYLTATFFDPETATVPVENAKSEKMPTPEAKPDSNESAESSFDDQAGFAELPFGITSFGAARLGDAIYVYGGHTGNAHAYSDEGQSKELLMLDLSQPTKPWQVVSESERLQGLGMVAHDSRLIIVGGFQARNKEGEEQDLHSIGNVRAYDIQTQQWSDLPALPEGRSSHDAALVGDSLYVIGGWMMDGDSETKWHTTALKMDLNKAEPKWIEVASPNFKRRALALAAHDGKLFAIGGMNEAGGPTRAVDVYDPATNVWAAGPELLGEAGMDGFGASAWSVNDHLTVTNIRGDIQVLSQDGQCWNSIGVARDARFFHRLLPLNSSALVSIGGANMESGKFLEPEVVEVK